MKEKIIYCCVCSFTALFSMSVKAQVIQVSGRVTSITNGAPISGVTISILGSKAVSQTDGNGQFIIRSPVNGTLHFTAIGFLSKDIALNGNQPLEVKLQERSQELEEVVIVAYGKSSTDLN